MPDVVIIVISRGLPESVGLFRVKALQDLFATIDSELWDQFGIA